MENPFVDSKKRSRKLRLIIPAVLMATIFVGTVIAIPWIYSNIVSVTVGKYDFLGSLIVDDDTPFQYQEITFSGTLYYDSSPVGSGYNVTLFKDDVQVASSLTDGSGDFSITYTVTSVGTFNFKVGYQPS